jgi:predicted AAA+ superfamily ATPase
MIMFSRHIKTKLEKALKRSPVILLIGARQTGKTTLIKEISAQLSYDYVTFDDIRYLSAAQSDPIGFIQQLKKPAILDEVQRIPELFLAIKQDVDANRKPGSYILTGSANPLLIPRLGDSLAGRMEIFNLFPLSQGEIEGVSDQFIDLAFDDALPHKGISLRPDALYKKIGIGGYPLVQSLDYEERESWFNSYVATVLQRDVQDITQITKLAELPLLFNLLATRAGSLLNVAELSRSSGISISTLHRYLVLFETLFLVSFQSPWSSNLGKRLVKSPKVYFEDTGLLSFALGLDLEKNIPDGRIVGPVVENFVIAELRKQASWSTRRVKIFYCRTTAGIEVDVVLEDAAGNIVCIEIKNSATVVAHDFKGIKYMQELVGAKFKQGIVLYTGSAYVPFGAQLMAMPIDSLWHTSE